MLQLIVINCIIFVNCLCLAPLKKVWTMTRIRYTAINNDISDCYQKRNKIQQCGSYGKDNVLI